MIAATLTDRDGRYRLTLAPGSYVVSGEREDYVRATADLEVADLDRTLDLRLVPAGVVEGIVKDVASGAPVAGAKVEASAARPGASAAGAAAGRSPPTPAGGSGSPA
jgi:protocatechuate 3,4-dioxygenase beta subunit